ncbi:MAG: endopeptidase La [Succinivibrio sp.]|uniref:endopeptidase La n=1 Tax=Succinivibrio sp. TaxID=2053619 RepID=UPI00258683FA|nr:endopeptidase La [Succinivibrio sp.]MCI6938132.1 endopeptidase La [Succinatimonas hippei]MDD6206343.1 endopeptidase La [Succinivibrio sp.]
MAENKEEKKSEVLSKDQVEKINKLLSSLSDEQLEGVKNRLSDLKKSLKENDAAEENGDDVMEIAAPSPALINVIPTFSRPVMPSQIAPIQLKGNFEKLITEIADTQSKCFALFSIDEKYESKGTISKNQFPKTGTLVRLLHAKSIPGEVHFVCEGICRVEIEKWVKFGSELKAKIRYPENIMPEQGSEDELKLKAYAMNLVALLQEILPLNPMYSEEMRQYLLRFDQNDPSMLADCAASITSTTQSILQDILETYDVLTKLEKSQSILKKELKAAKLQDAIRSSVNERLTKRQKEFVLKEQIKEIQKELGTRGDAFSEGDEFISRMKKLNPPAEIKRRFDNEIKKFNTIDTNSPEYGIARNYLETLCTIPWGQYAKENLNLEHAREVLDEDHEGLKDVKDRIIEFLAIGALKGTTNGSILLFVGPPGVGKTSIGKSIAKALNRPFYRLSLGGVGDDSVIKGHRKTYIGAMPGKFVQALRETKVMNPVIMLDEIDKLTHSYHGDPASSLLETLDPEQNSTFMDNYLDERLDLSKCLFICTANTEDTIPSALLDRMDKIRLSGYIGSEKLAIAKKHLMPKALEKAHLTKSQIKMSDAVLKKIIEEYARESGMRSTQRAIEKIIRKGAVKILEGSKSVTVKTNDLFDYLGTAPFKREKHLEGVGVITGLAWTSVGGATLPIESSRVNTDQKALELTGSLGDVMKESAHIAYSYIQSHIEKFAKDKKDFFKKSTIHIHVPEGATPKDGPSAGVTIASSLLSLAMNKAPKKGYAMTGELSLTGQVLAIGGIKEKTIAARRMGIFNIICPKANEDDVKELPVEVTEGVNYYFADTYEDVAKVIFDLKK